MDLLIEVLKLALTPVALISGLGLVLLSIINRLGRAIDRTRILLKEVEAPGDENVRQNKLKEISVLHKRSKMLRTSLISLAISLTCSGLLILIVVIGKVFEMNQPPMGVVLPATGFVLLLLSVLGIIVACFFFLLEVTLTLKALDYEISSVL